jgi:hypothetical protein
MSNWLHLPHHNADRNTPQISPEQAALLLERQELVDSRKGAISKKRGAIERYLEYFCSERQTSTLVLAGLGHVTLHRKGGVITSSIPDGDFSRINFGVTYDGKVPIVEIDVHPISESKESSFRFIGAPTGEHLVADREKYPLFHPLAEDGLERVTQVCHILGRAARGEFIDLPLSDDDLAELGLLDQAA